MRILAFDPGITTGIAYMEDGEIKGSLHIQFDKLWDWIVYLLNDENMDSSNSTLTYAFGRCSYIVIENFRLYAHKAQEQINSDFQTVQLIGALKLLCDVFRIPYHLQMASQIKVSLFSDEVLKSRWGIELKNKHERDAARHALLYWLKNKGGYGNELSICE